MRPLQASQTIFDIAIIGGGINGTGIARDAAGRGLNVYLCEQQDLAWGTSSHSSKLIHGGLRYLEHYEFRLVREALREREKLLRIAPHIIKPLSFIVPIDNTLRSGWLIRLGLFLYDNLAPRKILSASEMFNLTQAGIGQDLQPGYKKAFRYTDCYVDDARLVILNAISAREHGAQIAVRSQCIEAQIKNRLWHLQVRNTASGLTQEIKAKLLINATGPWINSMHRHIHIAPDRRIKLVQGSHIIVPRLYAGEYAYLLQHIDKRVVFVIPYQEKFSLIGTTDVAYTGDPGAVHITTAEINYLCAAINRYFKKNIKPEDIVSSYSGVRALFSEESENLSGLSRDYKIERLDQEDAPLINIFGGKITTYRRLAEAVMELLKPSFKQLPPAWTDSVPLPGGDIPQGDILLFARQLQQEYTWLPDKLCQRYANQYGAYCRKFLKSCHALSDLGYCFGDSLYQAEVDYLLVHEWAQTAEDVLWRRSKSGLWFDATAIQTLQNYLAERYVELQAG